MAEPIILPQRLGQPCWTDANLEATVRTVAALGDESAPRFLATHSPMDHIRVGDTDRTITDAEVFENISRLSARENVVLVQGAPGTGKSHLINWVKLRYDHALQAGELTNVVPVLVRRRTGSLKDALEQLVEQLPARFHKYLEPVQAAIARISEKEARKKLASELHLELGVRREEAGKPKLPRTIRYLPEAFHAEGFGAWLCREGGVIDRNIQRLISPSELRDRESLPEFTPAEFRISDLRQRSVGLNTENVRNLIDEFEEEVASAELAAQLCNESLRSALRELTGLGNAALSTILRLIRQDLQKDGQRLVLLIEDVSTLSVLDDEVVNAVEPQDDATLCELTSVLGMTEQAYRRLRDNQYQRIAGSGFILSFPKDAGAQSWASDPVGTDWFIGRYLNAARLPDQQVALIANQRRLGDDVNISACDDCPVRASCHATFGTVSVGETVIGLFPFRPGTAPYLLHNLDVAQTGVRPTQRGMLDHVIKPVLRHFDGLAQGDRRPLELPIRRRPPTDWQTLAETYLGGWSSNDQIRVRLLVEAWTPQTKAPEIASDLKSLLKPFSLPEFSAKAADPQPTKPQPKGSGAVGPTDGGSGPELPPEKRDPASEKLLTDLLNRVDRWWAGGKFETPKEHQELVLTFLKRALPLDDIRSPAVPAQRRLREANRGSIRIEDSATQPAGATVSFNLPRSQDTYDLLVALTHMSVAGRGSWNFSQGERYKRMASRWLRKHQDTMLQALDPEGLSTREPIRQATKFLALAAMVERRAGLPADTPAALAHLTSTAVVTPPTVLSESLGRLYADLPERRRAIQSFLVDETSLPQGDRGGIVVIDPQVITEAITEARGDPMFVPLSSSYLASYWKARYQPMDGLRGWTSLPSAIAAERQAIGHLVSSIDQLLAGYGFAAGGDYAEFAIFLTDTGRLIDLLRTQFRWPAGEIEFFKREKLADRAASLTRVLVDAAAVASGSNDADVLVFDPKDLQTVVGIVIRCSELVDRARAHAEAKMAHLREEGDPDEVERQIAEELARVGGPPVEVEA